MFSSGCVLHSSNQAGFRSLFGFEALMEAYADRLVFTSLDEIVELVKQYAGAMQQGKSRLAITFITALTHIVDQN